MIASGEISRKMRGWVVEYASLPFEPGLSAYLLVKSWQRREVAHAYSLQTCTIFEEEEHAKAFAREQPSLMGTTHHPACVRPVWEVTALTLSPPTDKVMSDFASLIRKMCNHRHSKPSGEESPRV